jgi:phasin family protein
MSDPTKTFTDMFKSLGEQLKVPSFDMNRIMEHQQKNLDAMARSWQAASAGAQEIAKKQRDIFEAAVKDITEMAKQYQPGGSAQEAISMHADFARKAMEAAIANTRDIAELTKKSAGEALGIVHDRMKESFDEIRASLEKK